MIDTSRIPKMFNVNKNLPEHLLQTIFDFTMGFYYAEIRIFDRRASIYHSDTYANQLLRQSEAYPIETNDVFRFFKERYMEPAIGPERLWALCNGQKDARELIQGALGKETPSDADKISAVFMVIIRLRHNLFHANKGESLNEDPEGQDILIKTARDYLSVCLSKYPTY
jgi:hypothetical protein